MDQQKAKTAIITGATRGIGKAIAFSLARQHYNVVFNYRNDDASAEQALTEAKNITPHVLLLKADVSQKADVERLIQATMEAFHSVDVLVNNAGINIDKPLRQLSEEDWDRVVDVNMKGVFLCSQIASRLMMQQEQGGIILNIGASTGIRGRKDGVNYCAAKAGVLIMTKCLAMELAPKIRVNCVIPGLIRTEETEQRLHLDDPLHPRLQEVPLKRFGLPEEIAETVSFLLSDQARYINGQKIIVDGGQYMW